MIGSVTLWSKVFPVVGTRKNQGRVRSSAAHLTHPIVLDGLAMVCTLWLRLRTLSLSSPPLQGTYRRRGGEQERHEDLRNELVLVLLTH